MKHRMLLLIIVLMVSCPLGRTAEPLYAGKPLAFWLNELKSDDPLIREEALLVLSDAGPAARAATPRLQELLKDDERGVRVRAALALWKIAGRTKPALAALTEALRQPELANRAEILSKLGELGREAGSSAALVLPFFDDADAAVRSQAMRTMQRFGTEAVPAILPAFDDANPRLRRAAYSALGLLGSSAREAVPKLTRLLEKGDIEDRLEAIKTLGRLGFAARSAAPAILKLTGDSDARLRVAGLTTLQFVGADPILARRAALKALEDEDLLVRSRGVVLLGRVAPNHPDILPHLQELLKQPIGRSELLLLVNQMGPRAARTVPRLTKLIGDADLPSRRLAVQALGNMRSAARSAVPALLEQLRSPDSALRQTTVSALRSIGGDSERIVPAVVEAAKLQDPAMRSMCLLLLNDHAGKAAAAVPWLVAELHRPPTFITAQMAETLHKIDPDRARKEAVPVLQKMIQPSGPFRMQAALMLRRIQPDSDEALKTLIEGTANRNANIRQQACQLLGTLGKSARDAAPALRKALRDSTPSIRVPAAAALWKITGETETTVPVLLEALKPSSGNYISSRYQAANLLGEMGPAVKTKALPALRKFRDDPDLAVRSSVRQAIQRIEGSAQPTKAP
ncbi:MAG: HEAT repeat domain-containing protein [Gemmataceae bacterium]